MRWPSFFGRGAAAKSAQKPEAHAPLREWASLPAIQRTVAESHMTAPTAAFLSSLAGTHDPDLSLEPLGHHVSLDAPSGLVTGLARSVETYARAGELVGRPKPQRERVAQRRVSTPGDESTSSGDEVDIDPAAEPVMVSAPVVDEQVPAHAPLTRLASPEAMAVMHLAVPRSAAADAPGESFAGEGASPEPALDSATRPVAAPRMTLGQSRRLGLGAPLPQPQATSVQRATEAPSLELAPPVRAAKAEPGESAPEAGSNIAPTAGAGPLSARGESALEAGSNIAPTAGAGPLSAPVERISPLAGLPAERAQQQSEAADPTPSTELPLARPAGTTVVPGPTASKPPLAQRAVATPMPPLYARPPVVPTAPVASERPPLLTFRRTVGSVDTDAETTQSAAVVLQRLPAVVASEPDAPAWRADLREVVAPAIHRVNRDAAGQPPRSLPPLAPIAPAVQRVATTAQDFTAFSPFATAPAPQTVQRATAVMEMPAIQRELTAGESPAQSPGAASAPAAGEGPAAGAAPGQADKDLDELGRKLYDRISLHLRRDLLVQRERAGMVTDLR